PTEGRHPPALIPTVAGELDERVERRWCGVPVLEVAEQADGVALGVVAGGVPAGDPWSPAFKDPAVGVDQERVGDVRPAPAVHVECLVGPDSGGALPVIGRMVNPQAWGRKSDPADRPWWTGAPLGAGDDLHSHGLGMTTTRRFRNVPVPPLTLCSRRTL